MNEVAMAIHGLTIAVYCTAGIVFLSIMIHSLSQK